MTPDFHLSNHA